MVLFAWVWFFNQANNTKKKDVQLSTTQADDCLNKIEALGIDLQQLATELQTKGVKQFVTAFNHILEQLT